MLAWTTVLQVLRSAAKRPAPAEILDVDAAARPQRPASRATGAAARGCARSRGSSRPRRPSASGWVSASPCRCVTLSARPVRRVSSTPSACSSRLQLERRHAAADGMGEEARRPAHARADVEHVARRRQAERARRRVDRLSAVIVPLVECEQLLGPHRRARRDAHRRQPPLDAIEVGVERHVGDGHGGASAHGGQALQELRQLAWCRTSRCRWCRDRGSRCWPGSGRGGRSSPASSPAR